MTQRHSEWQSNGLTKLYPLSCILFLLCIDPLLTHFESLCQTHHDLKPAAFADDISVIFEDWKSIHHALNAISQFNGASGAVSNTDKSCFVSTTTLDPSDTVAQLPMPWKTLQIKESETHLGIPVGRNITLDDICCAHV